jgi:uncharacterized protein YukE
MAMLGMDVDAVRKFATIAGQKADDINNVIATISSAIKSANWVGTDSTQFHNDWESRFKKQLLEAAQGLKEVQQKAMQNATAQENTSKSY